LGLAIVRGIVDAHHGEVTFSSDIATGTRVRVSIPRGAINRQTQSASPVDQRHELSTHTSSLAEAAAFHDVGQSTPRSDRE
jgi:hypothetical protein